MAFIILLHWPSEIRIILKVQKPDNVELRKFQKLSVTNILGLHFDVVGSGFLLKSNSTDKTNLEDNSN